MKSVDTKIMAFRQKRANELEELARFSERYGVSIGRNPSFKDAITRLKSNQHHFLDVNEEVNDSLWGYNIRNLTINVPDFPRHTFPPLSKLTLRVSINFAAYYQNWDKMKDPTHRLNLDVVLLGVNKEGGSHCLTSYHLDKDVESPSSSERKGGGTLSEVHPLYHVQFNNGKIRKEAEVKELDFSKSGNLFMDTPRLLHYPMYLILGFDFLMANYLPSVWKSLKEDGPYERLCREYQRLFWKPYIHAIARHWDIHRNHDCWDAKQDIWPNLR